LPGLTLATGRPEIARRILQTFASFVSQGMLPNVFPGAGDVPQYNTADASLWFFEAWRAYIDATGNLAALRDAFPILSDMVEWHRNGTATALASMAPIVSSERACPAVSLLGWTRRSAIGR
jgi:4-alpha-glucanotransferase